ncbi:MAG TPA: hypothetical protein VJR25_14835 [Microbacterium sp.]|uniref:hypothetical protein n=1 Tax=Microbacterium sp. TaxID=51671 RepID=UPI002B4A5498|nr:hypothetical protein [Microbacterium sp.]HKT58036.1 hypothetical protein [Microbacterium sp.]
MVSDAEVIAKLQEQRGWQRGEPQHPLDTDYRFADVRIGADTVDMAVEQRDGQRARIVIALPSSDAAQPWLYREPESADDWLQQFLIWMDEEILTGGLNASRARELVHGESYVIVVPYGWRSSDPKEHSRLMAASERRDGRPRRRRWRIGRRL